MIEPCRMLMGYRENAPTGDGLVHAPIRVRPDGSVSTSSKPRAVKRARRGPLGPRPGSRCWQLWKLFGGRTVSAGEVAVSGIVPRHHVQAYMRDLCATGKARRVPGGYWKVEEFAP